MSEKGKQKCEVYSRVVGYLSPVSEWNKGKKEEYKDRQTFSRDLFEDAKTKEYEKKMLK